MAANDTPLYTAQGKPTSQYFNEATNQWEPIKGRDGANSFIQLGTVAMEVWNHTDTPIQTFPSNRFGFSIVNEGIDALSFTINGQTRTVKKGGSYSSLFEPFTSVTVTATTEFQAEVLK